MAGILDVGSIAGTKMLNRMSREEKGLPGANASQGKQSGGRPVSLHRPARENGPPGAWSQHWEEIPNWGCFPLG